jgi:hypothetical protein
MRPGVTWTWTIIAVFAESVKGVGDLFWLSGRFTDAHRLAFCYNSTGTIDERGYSMELSVRFDEALVFASRLHTRQIRKGNKIPYDTLI